MKPNRTTNGILAVIMLAFVGAVLLAVPPWISQQYETVAQAGEVWVYVYFGTLGMGGALLLASLLWVLWRLYSAGCRKKEQREQRSKSPSELSAQQKQREVAENLALVEDLKAAAGIPPDIKQELEPLVQRVQQKQQHQTLEIVAFGTVSSGKSSLLNLLAGRQVFQTDLQGGTTLCRNEIPWPSLDKVVLVDTPGLGEIGGVEHAALSSAAAKDADLVLMVVDGPLREYEFQLLEQLGKMEKRVLICLNKTDWYPQKEKLLLLGQIADQVKDFIPRDDIVAVQAQPAQRTRLRLLQDGSEVSETLQEPADISPLAERMMRVIRSDGRDLLLANLLLQSRGLVHEAQTRVQQALEKRAWQIVDKYMWGAGVAAAVNPLPLVDLAVGCAVSATMIVELAKVYRQTIDLNTATNLLRQLGKNLLAILGASAATPAVSSFVGSLLKTVPGAGTIAGGLLQGITQALVTRWIGAVFISYFRDEMQQGEAALASLARIEWDRTTTIDALRKLVQMAKTKGFDNEPDREE